MEYDLSDALREAFPGTWATHLTEQITSKLSSNIPDGALDGNTDSSGPRRRSRRSHPKKTFDGVSDLIELISGKKADDPRPGSASVPGSPNVPAQTSLTPPFSRKPNMWGI
jgi:hypothetical protein